MNKKNLNYLMFFIFLLTVSCKFSNSENSNKQSNLNFSSPFEVRYKKLLVYPLNSERIPRSINKDFTTLKTTSSETWTSGFFAGNLWYLYLITNDEQYKKKALQWTKIVEPEKNNATDHDIGFKIYNSFGHAYKATANKAFANVIVTSANTLITRYDAKVKAIKSWDSQKGKWDYPVIIDNMINLELLFEASLLTKDSIYHNIAVNHANTTLKNHFRNDFSTYHVIDYSPNGTVKAKKTHQGFNDSSAWVRGQAWAVYGYTMAYRYTRDESYLNQAVGTAHFYLNHKNLPQDGIPYWDFDDPNIPNAPKDVSAAAIMASAFFELYKYSKKQLYIDYANKVLETLKKPEYLINSSINTPFILNRSTGNYNKNSEIDCPIVYADYYFLEALFRRNNP